MIKYKVNINFNTIQKIEVLRETEKSVFLKWRLGQGENREAKRSTCNNYFDIWNEAHSFLMQEAQIKINGLRDQLAHEEKRLAKFAEMKEK